MQLIYERTLNFEDKELTSTNRVVHGYSGGAVVNKNGELIGIANYAMTKMNFTQGFVAPIGTISYPTQLISGLLFNLNPKEEE